MKNLIVTSYYNIKSKFPTEQYKNWIGNFIGKVKTDIIIFTSSDLEEYFKSFHCSNLTIKIIELKDTFFYQFYPDFQKQWEKDNIKNRRSPELFILWYNKLWFVKQAYDIYQNLYDNYLWCDIGAFREPKLSKQRINFGSFNYKLEKLTVLILRPTNSNDTLLYPDGIYGKMKSNDSFIGGGVLAMPNNLVNEVFSYLLLIFNKLLKTDRFFGCDQRCYAYMYGERPDFFKLISPHHNYRNDPWFFLLDYFSI